VLEETRVSDWDREHHAIFPTSKFMPFDLHRYLAQVGSQVLWPDHAIEGTKEAELHPALWRGRYAHVQIKGMDPLCDSYSGINDALGRPTGLGDVIKAAGAKRVFVWGLAYDFCVGWTALDAAKLGFETYVVRDATRSVGLAGSVEKMDADLAAAGVRIAESRDLTL
jgi:nicotinamidase/pyrazinamidase